LIVAAEGHDGGVDLGNQLRRRKREVGADEIDQASFAKFVGGSVVGFGDAVGVNDEEVAWKEKEFLRDAFPVGG